MNYKLIMLDNPILISDEKDNGVMAWCPDTKKITFFASHPKYDEWGFKILAGYKDLPKLGLSLIAKGIGWVDVDKLALDSFDGDDIDFGIYWGGFDRGFKAAQKQKKYSEEDLFNLLKMVHDKRLDSLSSRIVDNGRVTDFNFWNSYSKKQIYASDLISEFTQSLLKPKEYLVEVSVENSAIKDFLGHPVISEVPKITNNTITVTKVLK